MRGFRHLMLAASSLSALPALAQDRPATAMPTLEEQFQDPPMSARPRVWWHWMNGNVTRDGIAKDLDWMRRMGIGGVQNFDASNQTPQIVDKRLTYMSPEWKEAFRFAAAEAERLGLEFAIASSPGFSQTGGPWVPPADGVKKLVWSETAIGGGKRFAGRLAPPPSLTGSFQTMPYSEGVDAMMAGNAAKVPPSAHGDVAVLAYRAAPLADPVPARVLGPDGKTIDGAALYDDDLATSVTLSQAAAGRAPALTLDYSAARTMCSATIYIPGGANWIMGARYKPRLQASDDGARWRDIAALPLTEAPTTISFAPVTARWFRVVFGEGNVDMTLMENAAEGVDLSGLAAAFAGGGSTSIRIGDLRLTTESRIDRFEVKAGFAIERDYYALSQGLGEAPGVDPASVINLTARVKPDGTLNWTPPKGDWRVLRLGWSLIGSSNHPASPEATGLEVDKLDGEAVRRYMEHYLGMYRKTVGPDLLGTKGVHALLNDSTEVGAANWTPRLIDRFRHLRGYDPTPWLPALTGVIVGSRERSDRFLYDFRRTLADLMSSEHYGTVAKVAHENGLVTYGEALEAHRPLLGDDMAMRSHTDVPMAAMWTFPQGKEPKSYSVADLRGAASVAHIYGRKYVAAELLTSSFRFWNDSPQTLKRVIDFAFASGVNRPVIHTSVHVPVEDHKPGLSLSIFGQVFNRNESWGELARPWIDYMARNALLLQQGRNVADIGYFYGEEAPLTALNSDHFLTDVPKAYGFDFVNADALTGALTNDGEDVVSTGGARYRALYLGGSSRRMTLATLERLAAMVEGGANVVGMKPESTPSLIDDPARYAALTARLWPGGEEARVGRGRVIASGDITAALARLGVAPDFRYTGGAADSDIPFAHRALADGDSYFVVNRRDRNETIEAHFRVTGKAPELWHADTGTTEATSYRIDKGETVVPLSLAPGEAVHVVFRKPAVQGSLAIKKLVPVELARIAGPWTVRFQPDRGAPATTTLAELAPLDVSKEPGIRYFSGIATYASVFATPRGWKRGTPLWLDLGDVREVAEVSIDGKRAGGLWHAPWRIDIGVLAKPGRNRLEVRVANLWANRLIGDAQPGAEKIGWTAMPTYRADAPLRRSGLIGPVRLLGQGGNDGKGL